MSLRDLRIQVTRALDRVTSARGFELPRRADRMLSVAESLLGESLSEIDAIRDCDEEESANADE